MANKVTDYQRTRVYKWEDVNIHKHDETLVLFKNAQKLVDYVWNEEGLTKPPKVVKLHNNDKTSTATATRMKIAIRPEGVQTSILLHEIAHSMTSLLDTKTALHGPRFVGVYIDLAVKYLHLDRIALEHSAEKAKVRFNYKGKVFG